MAGSVVALASQQKSPALQQLRRRAGRRYDDLMRNGNNSSKILRYGELPLPE
jgi:hypothetical protein